MPRTDRLDLACILWRDGSLSRIRRNLAINEIQRKIYEIGIVFVIAIEDAGLAVPLAKALTAGGIPTAEITFRTEAGEDAILKMVRHCPEVLVEAGTVLNMEQCDQAIRAEAKFIVSLGYNDALVKHCLERGVVVFPGCASTPDMTKGGQCRFERGKVFPGGAERRSWLFESAGAGISQSELYAHRWRKRQKPARLSWTPPCGSLRRHVDGSERTD